MQGLSDWGDPELPKVGDILNRNCGLYALVPDGRVGLGEPLWGLPINACSCWDLMQQQAVVWISGVPTK